MIKVPHPIPYQGSKRLLASAILNLAPRRVHSLYEPFAGSAALTLAAASRDVAEHYVISDKLASLAALWERIVAEPNSVADEYESIWTQQKDDPKEYYAFIRRSYNETKHPVMLLYLMARCVKNAIRFNPKGEFNQSADHRRLGMNPKKMRVELLGASRLLQAKATCLHADYRDVLLEAKPGDLVYMDPPYQGVSTNKDPRYIEQLSFDAFLEALENLNSRNVPYIISFDGSCGERQYGQTLPRNLNLTQFSIEVGRSSQATLNGREDKTVESLYVSRQLMRGHIPRTIVLSKRDIQHEMSI